MNADRTFRLLVLVAIALLAYLCWLNTRELVDLELQVDKVRGAIGDSVAPPVPPAADSRLAGSFEDSLRGD